MTDDQNNNPPVEKPVDLVPTPPKTQTPPPNPEKMVTVPLSFVEKATSLIDMIPKLNKQIDRLTAAADKSQLANYDMRNAGTTVRKVLVNMFDNKLVTGWRMTKDVVVRDAQGRWYEDQRIEIIMEDGEGGFTKKEMPFNPDFVHQRTQVHADIVSLFTTPEGQSMVRLQLGDRQVDLDTRFVN